MTHVPAIPPRDPEEEQDYAEWRAWLDAEGYDFADDGYQAEAFGAGMQAARGMVPAEPGLAGVQAELREAGAENMRLRALLDEIGVTAANAPEDGDSFGLLEEIAMRIAAADVPDDEP